jgi:PIN domain nuclease of toxin-antitoxin system
VTLNLLLDSHVALWWADDPSEVSDEAAKAIADPTNDVWVSAASAWELAIKAAQGKLVVDVRGLFRRLSDRGIRLRGIGVDDGIDAAALVWSHRDPFDRMLVAQAALSGLTVVTRDKVILDFVPDCVVA